MKTKHSILLANIGVLVMAVWFAFVVGRCIYQAITF